MNGFIQISVLDTDYEDFQFEIKISNGICTTMQDFYGPADFFKAFGTGLTEFPKDIKDVVSLEIGKNNLKWAYYILISAFCYNASGHSALKIIVDNHGDITSGHKSEFTILSEAASINKLGQLLTMWNVLSTKEIIWESYKD